MSGKKFKFDIFATLNKIAKKEKNFSKEELKALVPLVTIRWLSGTSNEHQIYAVNSLANRYCFSLPKHKELLLNLMTISGSGKATRYKWLKREAKKGKTKLSEEVIAEYYRYPLRRAKEAVDMLDDETIISHAEAIGFQKEQIRDLKKELKLR